MYLDLALGFINGLPPVLGYFTYETFPMPVLLIHQATIECLISNGIVAARNDLTYNNGGITVRISDGDRYLRYLQILYNAANRELENLRQAKIAANIAAGFGGVNSPYAYLHRRYTTLMPNRLF